MSSNHQRYGQPILVVVRDAALVAALFGAIALATNALRSDGIPLIAQREYEILVPCPEPLGEVSPLAADDPLVTDSGSLVIDGREADQYAAWALPGALLVTFDFLDPVSAEKVAELIRSQARRMVVYGDGDDPDSGRELARELAGRGAANVFFVEGGAPALMKLAGQGGGQ